MDIPQMYLESKGYPLEMTKYKDAVREVRRVCACGYPSLKDYSHSPTLCSRVESERGKDQLFDEWEAGFGVLIAQLTSAARRNATDDSIVAINELISAQARLFMHASKAKDIR